MARDGGGGEIVIFKKKKKNITAAFQWRESYASSCSTPSSAATSVLPSYLQANCPIAALHR